MDLSVLHCNWFYVNMMADVNKHISQETTFVFLSAKYEYNSNALLKDSSLAGICRGMYYMNSLYIVLTGYCTLLECSEGEICL